MAIDFTLTADQKMLQSTAREFAHEILRPLVAKADAAPDPQRAFEIIKPAYVEAYKLDLAMGPIPREYGGGGLSNVDLQIVTEEICAVDPGFACILLVNGLALMPLVWFGSKQQKKKWLGEATNDRKGEFLAGWVVSEPGGTAGLPVLKFGEQCYRVPRWALIELVTTGRVVRLCDTEAPGEEASVGG